MIKLAYNKANPNLVFIINEKKYIPLESFGVVEYYVGVLKDDSTQKIVDGEYKFQVMGFESKWVEVPTGVSNEDPELIKEVEDLTKEVGTLSGEVESLTGDINDAVTALSGLTDIEDTEE